MKSIPTVGFLKIVILRYVVFAVKGVEHKSVDDGCLPNRLVTEKDQLVLG